MALTAITGGDGRPPEPDWDAIFTDELDRLAAAEHWRAVVSEMHEAGTLAAVNAHTVKRLVLFYVEFDRSARSVAEAGKVTKTKSGVPQLNLEWTGMKQANEACTSLEAELGISPRRRNAAGKAQKAKRGASASERYLKRA